LGKSNKEISAIRADHPIPPQCKIIGIGFCKKENGKIVIIDIIAIFIALENGELLFSTGDTIG
ncbi:3571_t:CDS:2, partial [Gigaspora rosea]